jgi:hypothetical protein
MKISNRILHALIYGILVSGLVTGVFIVVGVGLVVTWLMGDTEQTHHLNRIIILTSYPFILVIYLRHYYYEWDKMH